MIKRKRFWIGLIVTLICLYFVFRGIDFKKLFNIIKSINLKIFFITLIIYIFGYYIRSIRWHFLLKHIKNLKPEELFPYLVMGFMFNNILPARAGEFIRAYITGIKKNISKSSTFATIIIERVFDGLIMIFYFLIGYMAFHYDYRILAKEQLSFNMFGIQLGIKDAVTLFAIVGSVIFLLIFIICFFLINKKEKTVNFFHKLISFFPKRVTDLFNKLIDTFIEGFGVLRNIKDMIIVFFFSAFAWTMEVFSYYLMSIAMNIKMSFLLVALIMAVANFAIMAPSTSGGVGPFEFFGVGIMLLFSYPKEEATAYIVIIHSMILLPIIFLGIIFIVTEGLDFQKLIKVKEEEKNEV
ncbi:MAG: flippase-like domain-containing protein [Candidatus Goldbacteria bacterium]|nr:flippase-like domain-containing protein [Candidatus Goldiibacteriota bacterium]